MTQPKTADQASPAAAAIDQDALALKDLARAVLDRSVRPRTNSIRRLAEAVLAKGVGKVKKKKDSKKAGKSAGKLATIPGQKRKKKV